MTAGDIAHEMGIDVERLQTVLVHPVVCMLVLLRQVPCFDALRWVASLAGVTTIEQAWAVCPRADWLVWLAGTLDEKLELDGAFDSIAMELGYFHGDFEHGAETPWDIAMDAVVGEFCDLEEHQEALGRAADIVREHIPWSAIAPLLPGGAS